MPSSGTFSGRSNLWIALRQAEFHYQFVNEVLKNDQVWNRTLGIMQAIGPCKSSRSSCSASIATALECWTLADLMSRLSGAPTSNDGNGKPLLSRCSLTANVLVLIIEVSSAIRGAIVVSVVVIRDQV